MFCSCNIQSIFACTFLSLRYHYSILAIVFLSVLACKIPQFLCAVLPSKLKNVFENALFANDSTTYEYDTLFTLRGGGGGANICLFFGTVSTYVLIFLIYKFLPIKIKNNRIQNLRKYG